MAMHGQHVVQYFYTCGTCVNLVCMHNTHTTFTAFTFRGHVQLNSQQIYCQHSVCGDTYTLGTTSTLPPQHTGYIHSFKFSLRWSVEWSLKNGLSGNIGEYYHFVKLLHKWINLTENFLLCLLKAMHSSVMTSPVCYTIDTWRQGWETYFIPYA